MNTALLIANGDSRPLANQMCWPAQQAVEAALTESFAAEEVPLVRAHPYRPEVGHGFIDSQRYGMEVFHSLDPDRPLVVAHAAWAFSHHVLHGLLTHRGPILTVANWSGQWPGLVGMLNLNGSLTKAGVAYSTLWSADFRDPPFRDGLRDWVRTGRVTRDTSHVHASSGFAMPTAERRLGEGVAGDLLQRKAIMGVFDEGCMGMSNAILPDHLLNATGVFKERLSQSALYHETKRVSDEEADRCFAWLEARGMTFHFGSDPTRHLTRAQVQGQLKLYVAALRLADDFGCDVIGIQYQLGLKDLLPSSDLAEGLLNNTDRPPVHDRDGGRELYPGAPLPHFNEVDEASGLDALVTNRLWGALGYPPETTLHDVRWGDDYEGVFVWVFEISGAAPPAHFVDGYAGARSERQPPMYFHLGGGSLKGVSKPGAIVWSRIYVEDGRLRADLGRGTVVALPESETERRWLATTPQWPIMHAVLHGVSRDQMMGRHKANHVQVAYAPGDAEATRALAAKAVAFEALGIETFLCGDVGLRPYEFAAATS